MTDYLRGRATAESHRRTNSGSHQSVISNTRSYRLDTRRQEEDEEASGSHAVRGDTSGRRQENSSMGDYLTHMPVNSRRSRGRVDSITSMGSSVAPGALPRWQGRNQSATRQLQPRESGTHAQTANSSVGATNGVGGLEAWLQSQAGAGSSSQGPATSFAPSGRVRKMNAVDGADIGSDAGRSTGARSAGPRVNGRSKESRSRLPMMPDWDPSAHDADAAGLGGQDQHRKLESVLRWRKDSNARSTTRERNDLTDFDSQIASESRTRKRDTGPGSFSASGLSVLREGVRRPRKLQAEPSLDALLSASRSEQGGPRSSLSRSQFDNGGNTLSQLVLSAKDEILNKEAEQEADPARSPLRSFVRWFLFEGAKASGPAGGYSSESGTYLVLGSAVLISILFKWITGLGSWSGRASPPMYGDFEAQRHWMEITLHLPRSQWYHYDLAYWGLDYPPLTALVSKWCAQVAVLLPGLASSLALDTSRGNESTSLVVYMRATVLVLDLLVYTPAILFFSARKLQGRGRRTRAIAAITILLQPSLILIDYGHFQYNTVMLGLSAAAFSLLYTSLPNPDLSVNIDAKMQQDVERKMASLSRKVSYEYILAAVMFSLSLCFKQMALYFAPAVFAVMLGRCWGLSRIGFERGLICFLSIGLATIATFAVVFRSWITDLNQLAQILHRVLPLARGIFEDKVSNIWCFLSVLPIPARYKLRNLISGPDLAKLSLATTLVVIILPCMQLFAAAAETVRIEMFLDQDTKLQLAASERRKKEGSVAGSTRTKTRKVSRAAPSEAGSDLASILSGGRGVTKAEIRPNGLPERQTKMVMASSSPSPAASVLPYALLSTSLAFFLFGFQTHEKSILLPLLPATLLISTKGDEWGAGAGKTDWEWAVLINNLAVFSMWPLLQRDGLSLQYATLVLLWNWAIGHRPFEGLKSSRQTFVAWFGAFAHVGIFLLHILELLFPLFAAWTTPLTLRYPDLFAVLNVLLCTPCLLLIWAWSLKRQLEVGFACGIDILSLQGKPSKSKSTSLRM